MNTNRIYIAKITKGTQIMYIKKLFRSFVSLITAILCVIGITPVSVPAAGTYTLHLVDSLQNTDALYNELARNNNL